MAIKIDGDINQYIKLVGRSDGSVKDEVQHIIDELGCTPVIREIDKEFTGYDLSESFWLLHDAGVEFRWKNDLLKGLSLYTKGVNHLYRNTNLMHLHCLQTFPTLQREKKLFAILELLTMKQRRIPHGSAQLGSNMTKRTATGCTSNLMVICI